MNETKRQSVDPNTAFLIELVCGFFGFLGVGYLYAGRMSDGILRLICWWIFDLTEGFFIGLFLVVVVGFCWIPVALIIQVAVPLWSANSLKKDILKENAK